MGQPVFRAGFVVLSSTLLVTAIACGGKDAGDPKSPTTPSASGSDSAAPSASATTLDGNTGTTTTTQLGDGGDLQGAKLGGSLHTTTETKGPSGAQPGRGTGGQSAQEPGRMVKDIQAIVVARRDEARACYDKDLAAHPGIEGDLDVKWVIDPQGNVANAEVDTTKSSILEPNVGACIVDVITKIKFAASSKGYETRAHYPFNFHPKTFSPKDAGK